MGYNLRRKTVLLWIWTLSPLWLLVDPSLLGIMTPHADWYGFANNVAILWLVLGFGAVAFRTVHLFFLRDVQTGLVWATKILTDPFHDVKLYHRAPMQLLRGELVEPRGSSGVTRLRQTVSTGTWMIQNSRVKPCPHQPAKGAAEQSFLAGPSGA